MNHNPSPENQFKPGVSGNPSGRPKGGLKDYDRKKFIAMTDEEKEVFLKGVPPEMRYRMAEGNPAQDVTSAGEKLIPTPILGGIANEIQGHDSTTENPLS